MNVKVKITSTLRDLAGQDEIDVNCQDGITLSGLQDLLVQKFGDKIIGKTSEYQWLHHGADYVVLALNGEVVPRDRIHQISLKEGDMVTLLPFISGG